MSVIRDFDINEWRSMSTDMQELAVLSAAQELRQSTANYLEQEKRGDDLEDKIDFINIRKDLLSRRAELSLAILRDDEAGLPPDKLNAIAAIIWPAAPDITSIPTGTLGQQTGEIRTVLDREPDFYISPTWGEKRGWQLLSEAQTIMLEIIRIGGGTITWGDMLVKQFSDWETKVRQFNLKFSQD